MPDRSLYQRDFFAWTQEQAAELRRLAAARTELPLDFANLAEEIESLGHRDARMVESHLARILEHLAKLEWSTAASPRFGWRAAVAEQRLACLRRLDASPSLTARFRTGDLARPWTAACRLVLAGLAPDEPTPGLPATCPYGFDQLLDQDWWPANRHGVTDR